MMIFAICVLLQILLHYNNHTVIGKSQRCFSRFHLFLPIYRVISRSIFFIRNSVKYKIYTTDGIDINCYIIIILYNVYSSFYKKIMHSISNYILTTIVPRNLLFNVHDFLGLITKLILYDNMLKFAMISLINSTFELIAWAVRRFYSG